MGSPLSDSRLQPRRTRLLVAAALALAALLAAGVFVAVPRGVSVGTLRMHSTRMRFNAVRAPSLFWPFFSSKEAAIRLRSGRWPSCQGR